MRYPPQVIDQIKARLSLVDEVRRMYPGLKKKGQHWWVNCPFHNEKSPSFHVREKGDYHCFGCGAHGDIVTFVMETQGMDFAGAVKDLAKRAGVSLPEPERVDPAQRDQRSQGYKALERAAAFYRTCLPQSPGQDYIERRGLSAATIAEFALGYAPEGWTGTRDALSQEGFSTETLRETGLCLESTKGKGKGDYDRFRARLMFPIHDLQGRVVAFGGRILVAKSDDAHGPKYLNSSETPYFSKSHLLYNLHRAKPNMRLSKQALLVEGYMDVLALWQAGIKTAVAPMGTSVTEDQLALLWQNVDKPTVCLDGDAAGRGAAIRVAQKILPILEPNRSIQFVWLPDGEDPDSLIRKDGLAAFHTLLSKPTTLEDVLWQHLTSGKDLTQADAKATVESDMAALVNTIRNTTVKKAYGQALRDRLWQATRRGGNERGLRQLKNEAATTMAPPTYRPGPMADITVRLLLGLVLRWPNILPQVAETLAHLDIPDRDMHNLSTSLLRGFTQGQAPEALVANLQEGLFADLATDLLRATGVEKLPDDTDALQEFHTHVNQWQARKAARQRREQLLKDLQQGSLDEEKWQQFRQL